MHPNYNPRDWTVGNISEKWKGIPLRECYKITFPGTCKYHPYILCETERRWTAYQTPQIASQELKRIYFGTFPIRNTISWEHSLLLISRGKNLGTFPKRNFCSANDTPSPPTKRTEVRVIALLTWKAAGTAEGGPGSWARLVRTAGTDATADSPLI